MSTTTVQQTTESDEIDRGKFYFVEPNTSQDPWKCGYYAIRKPKAVLEAVFPLYDVRSSIDQNGPHYTLNTHGFTPVKHVSKLFSPPYSLANFSDINVIRDIYNPEVIELVKSVTGAREVHLISTAVRAGRPDPPSVESDHDSRSERCGIDLDVSKIDFDKPLVVANNLETPTGPARSIHIDYSASGARAMLRGLRPSVREAASDIISAEDSSSPPYPTSIRRYAFYSIWRPLKPIMHDPLAICDMTAGDCSMDLVEGFNKQPGADGDFLTGYHALNGAHKEKYKWYWIKNQMPDEVLCLQFFDSHAEVEGRPIGVPHGSPELLGVSEDMLKEPRQSIEVRCLALW